MQNNKRTLQLAPRADNETVAKPSAPADLWERLNEEVIALEGQAIDRRPPDSFTINEYAEASGRSGDWASRRLQALLKKGILKRTKVGYAYYYYFASNTERGQS